MTKRHNGDTMMEKKDKRFNKNIIIQEESEEQPHLLPCSCASCFHACPVNGHMTCVSSLTHCFHSLKWIIFVQSPFSTTDTYSRSGYMKRCRLPASARCQGLNQSAAFVLSHMETTTITCRCADDGSYQAKTVSNVGGLSEILGRSVAILLIIYICLMLDVGGKIAYSLNWKIIGVFRCDWSRGRGLTLIEI